MFDEDTGVCVCMKSWLSIGTTVQWHWLLPMCSCYSDGVCVVETRVIKRMKSRLPRVYLHWSLQQLRYTNWAPSEMHRSTPAVSAYVTFQCFKHCRFGNRKGLSKCQIFHKIISGWLLQKFCKSKPHHVFMVVGMVLWMVRKVCVPEGRMIIYRTLRYKNFETAIVSFWNTLLLSLFRSV